MKENLKKNREMKRFFDAVPDKGPINPRDAYAGGRTMPFCLYAKATEEVEISMFDIISLYPFVNYGKKSACIFEIFLRLRHPLSGWGP